MTLSATGWGDPSPSTRRPLDGGESLRLSHRPSSCGLLGVMLDELDGGFSLGPILWAFLLDAGLDELGGVEWASSSAKKSPSSAPSSARSPAGTGQGTILTGGYINPLGGSSPASLAEAGRVPRAEKPASIGLREASGHSAGSPEFSSSSQRRSNCERFLTFVPSHPAGPCSASRAQPHPQPRSV